MSALYSQDLTRWNGERINDVLYPRNIAALWSDAELAEIGLYRAKTPTTIPDGKVVGSEVEWGGSGVRYKLVDGPSLLDTSRATKLAAIAAQIDAHLAIGAPVSGLHVALDDGSRADMTAMGTTAIAAASGALPWPDSYALGWITVENVRIALPLPSDGLALAGVVGNHYALIRQHGRNLKDLVEAAETAADVDAIDEAAGWPE
jgi:hypothetical protein